MTSLLRLRPIISAMCLQAAGIGAISSKFALNACDNIPLFGGCHTFSGAAGLATLAATLSIGPVISTRSAMRLCTFMLSS